MNGLDGGLRQVCNVVCSLNITGILFHDFVLRKFEVWSPC
ncbi:hypothetical protein SLEP1_g3582 [Rubroshorea leprosula]|uniref:Uncharacterized protein n=1 Tax=Rubroshorea leprosula TaxID=152421 RepID=A0AAV5HUP3_9ROSI|nr:hypothetical protein SLEP1_g3582 [Rubroshorea leprosula]